MAARLAHQWAAMRRQERREPEPVVIAAGPSNFRRGEVPYGVDLAAAWSWRLLVIAAAAWLLGYLISFFAVMVIPVVVALLISALVVPVVDWLVRVGVRRSIASILVVFLTIASVAALLTFAGQQVANGASDLADQTVAGLQEIKDWLRDGPLNASDSQIDDYIKRRPGRDHRAVRRGRRRHPRHRGRHRGRPRAGRLLHRAVLHLLLPRRRQPDLGLGGPARAARRARAGDSSGRVAWISLTQFVRATVIVAATDGILIGAGAAIIGVPFSLAIGVLVFLGAFVPIVGATVAGTVAILVALVDQGPVTALIMLAVVIGVQQLEGHVLQPFLMGRWVSVHPLGVILAIAAGVLTAGVAGRWSPSRWRPRSTPWSSTSRPTPNPATIPSRSWPRTMKETGETSAVEEDDPAPPHRLQRPRGRCSRWLTLRPALRLAQTRAW